jgi:alkanesulfonate monooxygenase SsuD/methylene tetrahydromethanopterin reductase-like flavin-dependent oxidoreductase (luciferase family)
MGSKHGIMDSSLQGSFTGLSARERIGLVVDGMNAAATAKTSIMHLETSIVPTYPRHPLSMAQQALAINDIVPARFRLGIGHSHCPVIEGVYCMSQTTPLAYMREHLQVIYAALWE